MLRRRHAAPGVVVCVVAATLSCGTVKDEVAEPVGLRSDIFLPIDSEIIEARLPRNGTLATLLRMHQVEEGLAHRVVDAALDVFDLRKLKADQP